MADYPDIKSEEPKNTPDSSEPESQQPQPGFRSEPKIPHTIIDNCDTDQQKKEKRERDRFRVEVATLIIIFFYTSITGYQGYKMRQATNAAAIGASAAQSAATTAKNTFDFNKDSVLTEIKKQTKAMQDSADSMEKTVKQGNAALNDTVKNFRMEQRAWVGPTHALTDAYIEEGKKSCVKEGQPAKCGIIIINSGKTPARKLRGVVSLLTLKAAEKLVPSFDIDNATLPHSNVVMQPGTQLLLLPTINSLQIKLPRFLIEPTDVKVVGNAEVSVKEMLFSKDDISDLASGKKILYMFGLITYEDIFKQSHWTKFCMYLSPDLTTFTGCSKYNETDD